MHFEFDNCGGCKTCEIACSFKCYGFFDHHRSLMQVVESDGKFGVCFVEDQDIRCNGCMDLEMPMCVRYCHEPDRLLEIINEYQLRMRGKQEA